MIRKNFDVT